MRTLMLVPLALLAGAASLAAQAPATPRDSALHALNRLAFGPTPGQVDAVAREGVMRWIDRQLEDHGGRDPVADRRRGEFPLLAMSREELGALFAERVRALAREQMRDSSPTARRPTTRPSDQPYRHLAGNLPQWAVVRATVADRQLAEVMTDFWFNHFNVNAEKGAGRFLVPDYVEHVIRPRALGRFDELLLATAESPAMLFYLDNVQSVVPGFEPRVPLPERLAARRPKGLNENYARELLELHTLGVDGGYTQRDVTEAARILTGWTMQPPRQGGGFTFRARAHDTGAKTVLGVAFPAGRGQDEGKHLIRLLAAHPATMHHVAAKLCVRLVSDEPSDECIDDAVRAWQRSGGEIREVLRAIVRSEAFWAPAARRSKVKSPFEFVVSAVRALGADPDSTPVLGQSVARLGQPLFRQPSPAGYPESQAEWVNSGALLGRMNFAMGLAAGRMPGVHIDLDRLALPTTDHARLLDAIDRQCLSGTMSERSRATILRELADVRDPVQARALAVGLALGGPDFQRQ
jgi:uncharacterized protein (DUF1800 family)